MALSANAAAVNTKMDELMAAVETYCDGLSTDDVTQIVWVASLKGDNPNNSKFGADTTAVFPVAANFLRDRIAYNPNVTGDIFLEIAGKALFWKITNDAGDLTT